MTVQDYKTIFTCPECSKSILEWGADSVKCNSCNAVFPVVNNIPVLFKNSEQRSSYSKMLVTKNNDIYWKREAYWDKQFISEIPEGSGYCLDIGCGGGKRELVESKGYKYIGLDYFLDNGVDVLADACNIPLKDRSIDLCVNRVVMEHIPDPWKACREMFRVLKSGGLYVGSVAFIQPFHENSYYHMTHKGVEKMLSQAGFEIIKIEPLKESGLETLMGTLLEVRKPVSYIIRLFFITLILARRFGIMIFAQFYRNKPDRLKRIKEFKEEEKYRFASGFLFVAKKG